MKSREPGAGNPNDNNGTFPFNKDSTAFSADYVGSELRGCFEGWVTWLLEGAIPVRRHEGMPRVILVARR